jgi:hypothetical protein
LGDVERDGGWDRDVTASFEFVSSGLSVDSVVDSRVDRWSSIGLSGPVRAPSVDIRCMIGAGRGSGTERALPVRAADFGGTIGLGFDGPATAPPPNLSFIACTDTVTSIPSPPSAASPPNALSLPSLLETADEPLSGGFDTGLGCALRSTGGAANKTGSEAVWSSFTRKAIGTGPVSRDADAEEVRGSGTGFAELGAGTGLGEPPAARDSNRDLSDAIDTGASSSIFSSTRGALSSIRSERGGVGGAIFYCSPNW